MDKQNVVIIGSGLGGLVCGAILAREGYSVCILERNKQIGGTLQTYARNKIIFDSGVHYVGGLGKGQNLNRLFTFLGIMDKVNIRQMDVDMVDGVMFRGDPKIYRYAQGYDRFIQNMVEDFPDEEIAIRKYCDRIKAVCERFPMYNLRMGSYLEQEGMLDIDVQTFIESITSNKKLQHVLMGTNLLYAGVPYKTPFYVHALIINSYIESSWRFVDGGSQIARLLAREITTRGGIIKRHVHITRLVEENGMLQFAESSSGERFYGNLFISNVHPAKTIEMTESSLIKKVFRNRMKNLENSISMFYVSIVLKKNKIEYRNSNLYCYGEENPWCIIEYTPENWPNGFALFYSASSKTQVYAEGITLMGYMRYEEVKKWEKTFNTVTEESGRGEEYENFKKEKAEKLFAFAEQWVPGLKEAIEQYYVATPLTLRDYVGTNDGSLYGFVKDYRDPMRTFISTRTKIPNLFLTGQNINLHGVLGVTVSAVITCSEILGREYILNKIEHAQA
ncbi:MAG: NAD(P)/FAD-dependent oxidoreductase [Cyclobacteriaceae bacterium]|nr:NAD(P)/FAD-dependent oxidoreductase [Cyclobacteriaceae bacterium]